MLCIIVPEYQSAVDERANQRSTETKSGEDTQTRDEGSETDEESETKGDERVLRTQVV